jgi:hypothetical protein
MFSLSSPATQDLREKSVVQVLTPAGCRQRPDIQNLRQMMSQPGWQKRLSDMLQAGKCAAVA